MKQTINGDDNVQVGTVEGPLIIDKRRPIFQHNDPNVVECPYGCGQQTWFNSDKCWNCDRPVAQYFIDEDREKRRKEFKQTRFSEGVLAIVFSACIYMVSPYLIESIAAYTKFFSFPFLMMGVVMIGQSIRA